MADDAEGFGPFPEVHPRVAIVQKAEGEANVEMMGFARKHDLTRAEGLLVWLNAAVTDLQYAVRQERRQDTIDQRIAWIRKEMGALTSEQRRFIMSDWCSQCCGEEPCYCCRDE